MLYVPYVWTKQMTKPLLQHGTKLMLFGLVIMIQGIRDPIKVRMSLGALHVHDFIIDGFDWMIGTKHHHPRRKTRTLNLLALKENPLRSPWRLKVSTRLACKLWYPGRADHNSARKGGKTANTNQMKLLVSVSRNIVSQPMEFQRTLAIQSQQIHQKPT